MSSKEGASRWFGIKVDVESPIWRLVYRMLLCPRLGDGLEKRVDGLRSEATVLKISKHSQCLSKLLKFF